jgi:hypothetical protein
MGSPAESAAQYNSRLFTGKKVGAPNRANYLIAKEQGRLDQGELLPYTRKIRLDKVLEIIYTTMSKL